MSTDLRVAAGRQWITLAVYGVLGLELAAVIVFAATYNALDFRIYMWGGHAVLQDGRLYQALAYGHWFTYSPFAAIVYVPAAALPLAVARVLWDLLTVAALAYSCVLILKLAGYRPSRIRMAGMLAAAMALDPVWQTLFLGQINLILLALILIDIRRVTQGRTAGIGVGIAAAIKLTPAIFIVFFLLARRTRAAMVAAATFAACGLIGCIVAPDASRLYWRHLFFDTHRGARKRPGCIGRSAHLLGASLASVRSIARPPGRGCCSAPVTGSPPEVGLPAVRGASVLVHPARGRVTRVRLPRAGDVRRQLLPDRRAGLQRRHDPAGLAAGAKTGAGPAGPSEPYMDDDAMAGAR